MKRRATRSKARKYRKRTRRGGGFFNKLGCTGAACSTGVVEEPGRPNIPSDPPASEEEIKKFEAMMKKIQNDKNAAMARTIALKEHYDKAIAEQTGSRPQLSTSNIPTLPFNRYGFGNTRTQGLPETLSRFGKTVKAGLPETRSGFGRRV